MEETWTVSGVCGHWRCTIDIDPGGEYVTHPIDPVAAMRALESLKEHFLTLVNLLETKTLWELEESRWR